MVTKKASTATARKTTGMQKAAKGDSYQCEVCGLAVTVDETCGCSSFDLLCCGQPMKAKKSRAKATAAAR